MRGIKITNVQSKFGRSVINAFLKSRIQLIVSVFIISMGCFTEGISQSVKLDEINSTIKRSADYLSRTFKENGMFEYRINMDSTVKVKPKYNILRHAGAMYSLAMYYTAYPDEKVRAIIERAGRYLQNEIVLPVKEQNNMQAIWSKPEVNGTNDPLLAKLGGSGLGLVALVCLEDIQPGFTSLSDLEAIGNFIVYMQKENGSFYSKYIPSEGGRQDNWTSLYYPGEAALGLIMLHEKNPSKIWFESAYKVLQYLALSRKNRNVVPADHWALLATEKLLSAKNNYDLPISRELLLNHAIQICESILNSQVNNSIIPKFNGGYAADGRTTPTATRLEGLLAALNFIPQDHEIWKRIDSSVSKGISFLVRAQIKEGEYAGVFPRGIGKIPGNSSKSKKFNRRSTEVRIDYIQHAMSALIQFQRHTSKQGKDIPVNINRN